jgi:tetratricopeptide (TPR) repeat protein
LTLVATPARAQKQVFIEGLTEFTAAVQGTYGDEGAHVRLALDKMAGGLAEWDRTIRAYEARLVADLPAAPRQDAYQMHVALGEMYTERGRLVDALRELDAAARLEPRRADAHVRRGSVLEALARPEEAAEAFRTAWNLDQADPVKAYLALRRRTTDSRADDLQHAVDVLSETYRRLLADGARNKASPFPTVGLLNDRAGGTPILPQAAYAPGYALVADGEYAEAIDRFKNAAAGDPLVTDPASRSRSMMQAVAALRQGRVAEARSLVERSAVLETGSSEAFRILGGIDNVDSQYDESLTHLQAAIQRNPTNERARLAFARVLTAAGRDDEAERALQETIRVLPDSALAHWWLGSLFERLNQFADARREFELAARSAVAGKSQFLLSIGRLASSAADGGGAVEVFAHAVRSNPNDGEAHKHLAWAMLQGDRADEAFAELVAALLIDPSDGQAHAGIGQIHLDAGRNRDAVTALRRALEIQQGHAEARYALATALNRLGQTQEAARELERFDQQQQRMLADRRRNMTLDVLREEAALRAAEGAYDRAAALWQQVIDQQPERSSDHLGLAAALTAAGQIDAAIAQYEKAITLGADPVVYRQLAELYAKAGRTEDSARARTMYDRALQGLPTGRGAAR